MLKPLLIFFLFGITPFVFSQGVCDISNGVEKGGFSFDGPAAGCHPFSVKIKDNSGGTDVKYIFDYKGEPASKLPSLNSTTSLQNTFPNFTDEPITYSILQYGKKNGKDMYYCNTVVVRKDNKPKFSYTPCNNNSLQITIPANTPENDFDYYTIDWGDGNTPEKVNKLSSNYSKTKSLTMPRTIKVQGFYNAGSSCPNPNSITIPTLAPSSFPNGYNLPNYPNISRLEMTSGLDAKLTLTGSFDDSGYSLYMTEKGKPYSATPNKNNIKPSIFTVSIPDSTKSYCFYVSKPIVCGTESSAEICTTPIDVTPQGKDYKILWDTYPTTLNNALPNNTSFGRYVTSVSKITKKEDNILNLPISPSSNPYYDVVDCQKKYCYRIETQTKGQIYYYSFTGTSLSKEVCMDRKNLHPPAITDAQISVNDLNQAISTYTDNSGWALQKTEFRLLRNESGKYTGVDSTAVIVKLIDKIDASQKSYCYKLDYTDECGSTSEPSSEFCTVNLSETGGSQLKWTTQSPYANTIVSKYEIQFYDENTGAISTEVTNNASQNTHNPNLDNFEEEAKYRVRVLDAGGKESFSNVYIIPIQVKVFIPDAFSPNGDTKNDNLEIFGTFRRIQEFSLKIYNRWGIPVFTTDDPKITWDGTYLGQAVSPDVYTYSLLSKLSDGQKLRKMGSIRLIR